MGRGKILLAKKKCWTIYMAAAMKFIELFVFTVTLVISE